MAYRRSRKARSKRSLKPLLRKIKGDISKLQKANLMRLDSAVEALKRDVKRLDARMDSCDYTMGK